MRPLGMPPIIYNAVFAIIVAALYQRSLFAVSERGSLPRDGACVNWKLMSSSRMYEVIADGGAQL